jgi:Domain of unknown function (DUF5668)/B-box zinc finger
MNCAVHTDTPAVAYCRTCGKALCENCKRDVMGAIYCEPCIAARLQGGQAAVPAAPVTVAPGAPSPGLAGFLGLIPGVGAWYNGQFVKGFIHVMIFALLIVAESTVHEGALEILFGLLIFFSPIYMAFDAYNTAQARLLGRPAPDPLGLERLFGVQEGHTAAASAPPATVSGAVAPPPAAAQPRSNEPIGAIVLIALGVLFLLTNLTRFDMHRFWPLILIAIGLWIGYKRTRAGA